jgi:G3E family GTPase
MLGWRISKGSLCIRCQYAMVRGRKLTLPVPTTIVTGALGSGKTTALCSLIQGKPVGQVWAVVVNEFGAVGLDAATMQASVAAAGTDEVAIKQIAGGCMCCVSSGLLSTTIAQIIRTVKPDRLLVEPSGLGHPAGACQPALSDSYWQHGYVA